jgi:outer membrane protein TolC
MAKVGQAKMELEKTRNQKEQQSQMLILGAQQALNEYNSAFENYTNEKQNFELSKKVFDQTTLKFKQGMVSALDLTTVNNQLLQAQLSFAAAVQDLLTKKVALDKAYSKL